MIAVIRYRIFCLPVCYKNIKIKIYGTIIFMFAPCITNIKTLFTVPTDAHYIQIIEY